MEEVLLDPKNAREHSNANLQAIARSLKNYGQVKPIIVNRHNGQIEAGNGTYLAARTLGWTHIAILKVEHDAAAQRGFSIADNRTAELANWNDLMLAEALSQIKEESPDLHAELLLSELAAATLGEADAPPAAKPGPPAEKLNTYQIVVQCTDAMDRRRLLRSLRKQGRRCRALTWEGQVEMPGAETDEGESGRGGEGEK